MFFKPHLWTQNGGLFKERIDCGLPFMKEVSHRYRNSEIGIQLFVCHDLFLHRIIHIFKRWIFHLTHLVHIALRRWSLCTHLLMWLNDLTISTVLFQCHVTTLEIAYFLLQKCPISKACKIVSRKRSILNLTSGYHAWHNVSRFVCLAFPRISDPKLILVTWYQVFETWMWNLTKTNAIWFSKWNIASSVMLIIFIILFQFSYLCIW